MKFSKEARIGLMVAIAIVIFFAGFYFLKGSNIFSGENDYYADYSSVQGLTQSAVVQIKGVAVGKVSNIKLDGPKVRITLSIDKKVKIPKNSVAELISLDLLGTKAVRLNLTNDNETARSGDQLPTAVETGIIDNISSEISPLVADVRSVVHVLDSVLTGVNGILNDQTRQNLSKSVASLNTTMENFSQLSSRLNKESEEIASVIRNANSITTNIKNNNDHITNVIKNAETTTDHLAKAPIEQTVKDLQKMADQLNQIAAKANSGEGTIGMALNDKKLYEELTSTLTNLKTLMADLQQHPSRYINVTIFGRKAKTTTP
ncbi:MlaD family protein [Chitinophagaceae bacterium MMS25-I14]